MSSDSLFTKCKYCGKDVPTSIKLCPYCSKKLKKISFIQWIGIFILAIIFIGLINAPEKSKEQSIIPSIKEKTISNTQLDYVWTKEGFGTFMEANFVIHNNNDYDIKDIEIECDHYAKSGTKIDKNNRTIYEIISAKSSKTYPKFNMGFIHEQADSSTCFVKNLSLLNH